MDPLHVVMWGQVLALVIHIFEESTLGGTFVEKVRQHWWPEYSWRKFFWFNTIFMLITVLSICLYDAFEGHWVILPLAFIIHFVCNAVFHLWWAIRFKEYSPGLLTSVNYWVLLYFVIKFGISPGLIASSDLTTGIVLGCLLGLFTSFGTFIAGKIAVAKRADSIHG